MAQDEAGTITRETAAKLLMVTPRYITQLVKDGWIQKSENDRYTIAGVVQGYIKCLKDEKRRNSQKTSQSKVSDARSREIELRIAEREKRLMPVQEVLDMVADVIGNLKSEQIGIPARVSRDRVVRSLIEDAIAGSHKRAGETLAAHYASCGIDISTSGLAARANTGRLGAGKSKLPAKRRGAGAARAVAHPV